MEISVRKICFGKEILFSLSFSVFQEFLYLCGRNFQSTFINAFMTIEFFTEGVAMPALDYDSVRRWIADVAREHGFGVGQLNYCFCNDAYILKTNVDFLDHDYYTDIITFDYTHDGLVAGDMVISLDTVASNAAGLGQEYCRELLRVIIHGVLHLCGIDDKGPGEREIMESHENAALAMWDALS